MSDPYRKQRTKADILLGVETEIVKSRIYARSTVEYWTPDRAKHLRYHDTNVVTIKKNGDITLDSGGWQTRTTKDRINNYQGVVSVYSDKGMWKVGGFTFVDGISFAPDGTLKSSTQATEREKRRIVRVSKQIKHYCKTLKTQLEVEGFPVPNSGDCLICRLPKGRHSCLTSHLDETYIHGTLLVNAMQYAGYDLERTKMNVYMKNWRTIVNSMRRYLRHSFGLAT